MEKESEAKSLDNRQEVTVEDSGESAGFISSTSSMSGPVSADALPTFVTAESAQDRANSNMTTLGPRNRSQNSGLQNPIENISRLYTNHLESNEAVKDIIIDASSTEKEYTLYTIIDEESLEVRVDVMSVTQNIRDIHPTWDITAHIVAEETDPNLGQVPQSAIPADKLLAQKDSSEFGYAF